MKTAPANRSGGARLYAWSWVVSILVHGVCLAGGIVLLSDLRVDPEPEPFRWEIALGAPSRSNAPDPPPLPQPREESSAASVQQLPAESVQAPPQLSRPPVAQRMPPPTPKDVPADQRRSATSQSLAREIPTESWEKSYEPLRPLASERPPSPSTYQVRQNQAQPIESSTGPQPPEEALRRDRPAPAVPKPDYSWLAQALWNRVHALNHYPLEARLHRMEGQVVLRIVIQEDGTFGETEVVKTSGHPVLDDHALDVVKRASPLSLAHPLRRPYVVVHVPVTYRLDHR